MVNRPAEMKDILPNKACALPIMDFEQLCNNGMRMEDAIDSNITEGKMYAPTKKIRENSSKDPNV